MIANSEHYFYNNNPEVVYTIMYCGLHLQYFNIVF